MEAQARQLGGEQATCGRATASHYEQAEGQHAATGGQRDEWFRHMYKQMHQKKQTPERSVLQAVNAQPADTNQIRIKLKAPKNDHRFSPSYYSEEDFIEQRRSKSSVSPTFKPGNICDYLPGKSSINQHERNLRQAQSGPQTPVLSNEPLLGGRQFYRQPLRNDDDDCDDEDGQHHYAGGEQRQPTDEEEHGRRCVFKRLLREPNQASNQEVRRDLLVGSAGEQQREEEDPRKQYVSVQQGHDIPLKGLRKAAPQPSIYKEHLFSDESINIHYRAPTSKLLKMNTFNEFELNRIKRMYKDELTSRLQRSRSGRLPSQQSAALSDQARFRQSARSAERLIGPHPSYSRAMVGAADACQSPPCVDLNRYQRALLSKRRARPRSVGGGAWRGARFGRALFDFQAKSGRELSLKRGDLVEMLELLDHNWALVEDCQSGLQGLAPLNYIDYSVGCAVARRDVMVGSQQQHSSNRELEKPLLQMSKGEPITLLRRLRGHCYEASNTRQAMGIVWSNDLDIIKQPVLREPTSGGRPTSGQSDDFLFTDDDDDDDDDEADDDADDPYERQSCGEEDEMLILESGERVLARRRARSASGMSASRPSCCLPVQQQQQHQQHQHQQQQQCCRSHGESVDSHLPRRSSSSPYISTSAANKQQVAESSKELPRLCRVKFPYKPRQKDELELVVGDILVVVHECDDGWFIGSSYTTKEMGTFPGNFLEPI